jgi:hypothetical protein|tara:strand:+ start:11319 stop:11546 length:228 start_codon:yes stop_codon:yes gene_type:complete
MKNINEIKESRSKLNSSELADLKWLHTELENLLETDEVSRVGLVKVEGLVSTFNNFRVGYTQRVINLLKQGNILD